MRLLNFETLYVGWYSNRTRGSRPCRARSTMVRCRFIWGLKVGTCTRRVGISYSQWRELAIHFYIPLIIKFIFIGHGSCWI
jgi:hypothetical protein